MSLHKTLRVSIFIGLAFVASAHSYPIHDVYEKLVQNNGEGFDQLYGVRNFRMLFDGLVYRGGANNTFQRDVKLNRSNMNPLQLNGLNNLCEEGFGTAVYLYSTNFESAPKKVACKTRVGNRDNVLNYLQLSPQTQTGARAILELIYARLTNQGATPLYLHCWNGWHASGLASALALRQFCNLPVADVVAYWNRNTDGNDGSGYEAMRVKIREFVPYADLVISADSQRRLCPSLIPAMFDIGL